MSADKKTGKKAITNIDSCVVCGANVIPQMLEHLSRPTNPEVTVYDVSCSVCEGCDEKYFNADQLRLLERKTNEALRKAKHYLTAEEINQLIQQLSTQTGLAEGKLAKALGVSRQELHRWKNSERIQSPMADNFLRFAAEDPARFANFVSKQVPPGVQRGRPRTARA